MNIYFRELKAHRKALIIWSVCMFLLIISGMSKYVAYSSGGGTGDIFAQIPQSVRALLGMGSFDVTSMAGFFAMLFLYTELTVGIHAVLLGSGIISKEERDKTVEFLMAKPVSRSAIAIPKLFAAVTNIVILNIVTLFSSIVAVSRFEGGKDIIDEIFAFMGCMLIFQLVYFGVGALAASLTRRPKTSGTISVGIMIGGFVISRITDLNDKLSFLNIFSPFKYFSYARIVEGNGLDPVITVITVALVIVFAALTCVFYSKRDMTL